MGTTDDPCRRTGQPSHKQFILPDGTVIPATEIAEYPFEVRKLARVLHITPGVSQNSLLSTVKFADANYITIFDKDEVNIYDANDTTITVTKGAILRGWRDERTNLWRILLVRMVRNLNTDTALLTRPPSEFLLHRPNPTEAIHSVYELKTQPEIVRYLHAAAGFPTKPTWLKAIKNKQFSSWPGLTVEAVRRHFPDSDETHKGHGRRTPSGLRSTKRTQTETPPPVDESEDREEEHSIINKQKIIFCKVYDVEEEATHKIWTDQTGRFPKQSSRGNQYIMVLVESDSSAILVEPMKNRTAGEMTRAYQTLVDRLNESGIFPKEHILDNECSDQFKKTIKANKMTYQLVPPHDHRRNRAEKAIQTFKDHFVSILCGTDSSFPLNLWDRLLTQAEMTLNMLRPARMLKTVSAYTYLYGQHDYNSNPFAPLGCKVEAHVVPEVRETWAPHTASGYYIGNASEHYRCHKVYISDTRSTRVCSSVFFKHKYLTMPTLTPSDALIKAADTLSDAITGVLPVSTITNDAITALLKIFKDQAKSAKDASSSQRVLTQRAQAQRVNTEQSQEEMADDSWMDLIEDLPDLEQEFPPLEIEEEITTIETPSQSPRAPNFSSHKSTPAENTRQQHRSRTITQDCAYHLMETQAPPSAQQASSRTYPLQFLCDWAHSILDDDTGDLLEYRHLMKHPKYKDTWTKSFSKEIRRLATTTETIFFLTKPEIPEERRKDITYGRIVCTYRSEKKDPNRTRITMGGNLVNYPDDCGTPTADLLTVKLMLNSIISTPNSKFMTIDLKDFYLLTPMSRYE